MENLRQDSSIDCAELHRRGSSKWSGVKTKKGAPCAGAWIAESDLGTAPAVAQAIKRAVDESTLGYLSTDQTARTSTACANFQKERFGWQVANEEVSLLHDVLTGLRLMIDHLTRPDSPIVVPTPAYTPFRTIPGEHGRECIEVPSLQDSEGNWKLDLQGIKRALEAGAGLVILCNPWNPTGRCFTATELREFGELICSYDALVFSDEIHSSVILPGYSHIPFASLDLRFAAQTITLTAASKGWNVAGLKCAQAIVTDEDLRARFLSAPRHLYGHPVSLGALAAEVAYTQGVEWLDEICALFAANIALVRQVGQSIPGVKINPVQATYLTWWDCSEVPDLDCPAELLCEGAQIAVNAGSTCGAGYEKFFRFNAATYPHILGELLGRIGQTLAQKSL